MKIRVSENVIKGVLVIWYLVGIAGFLIVPIRPLFQKLTPLGMLMAAIILMVYHEPVNIKSYLIFSGIAVLGFLAELTGVNTRLLFGSYEYGIVLGTKLFNTPLIIGLNWLVLVYCITVLYERIRNRWFFPFIGAATMVIFDFFMEPVAVATGMWSWEGQEIPLKNYIDWFLVSGLMFLIIKIFSIEIKNPLAKVLLVMQFMFFLVLNVLIRTSLWAY
jgi:uncharacterized membrane protein